MALLVVVPLSCAAWAGFSVAGSAMHGTIRVHAGQPMDEAPSPSLIQPHGLVAVTSDATVSSRDLSRFPQRTRCTLVACDTSEDRSD